MVWSDPAAETWGTDVVAPMAVSWRSFVMEGSAWVWSGDEPELSQLLVRWIASRPSPLGLTVVVGIAGEEAGVHWIKLGAPGATMAQAVAALREAADDLDELLELYGEAAVAERPELGVGVPLAPLSDVVLPGGYRPGDGPEVRRLVPLLQRRRGRALQLAVAISFAGVPSELLQEWYEVSDSGNVGDDDTPFFMVSEREVRVQEHIQELSRQISACSVRLSLHGDIPRSALLGPLVDALSCDVRRRLAPSAGDATLQLPAAHLTPVLALLGTRRPERRGITVEEEDVPEAWKALVEERRVTE